jgi:TonB family protein
MLGTLEPVTNARVTLTYEGDGRGIGNGAGPEPRAKPLPPDVYYVGRDVSAPQLKSRVEPDYTDDALRAHIQGPVTLEIIIQADGSTTFRRITKSVGYGLDESAQRAVEKWRFEPARKGATPVAVLVSIVVNFRLPNGPVAGSPPPATIPANTSVPTFSMTTDSSGNTVFSNLAPGRYLVRAERSGYVDPSGAATSSAIVTVVSQQSATTPLYLSLPRELPVK